MRVYVFFLHLKTDRKKISLSHLHEGVTHISRNSFELFVSDAKGEYDRPGEWHGYHHPSVSQILGS